MVQLINNSILLLNFDKRITKMLNEAKQLNIQAQYIGEIEEINNITNWSCRQRQGCKKIDQQRYGGKKRNRRKSSLIFLSSNIYTCVLINKIIF